MRDFSLVLAGVLMSLALRANAADTPKVALIHVDKSERHMELHDADGNALKKYSIALGDAPIGKKTQQGDEKTPEGAYTISGRNPASSYHLSLRISYPNKADTAQARKRGVSPGGDIMIHGQPNSLPGTTHYSLPGDWTDGCIAVSDAEMDEIWSLVPTGTPIEIVP